MGLDLQQNTGAHPHSQKVHHSSQITSMQLQEGVSPFPSSKIVREVVVFASSLVFLVLISCALLSFCPAPLKIALKGL